MRTKFGDDMFINKHFSGVDRRSSLDVKEFFYFSLFFLLFSFDDLMYLPAASCVHNLVNSYNEIFFNIPEDIW